MWEQEFLRWLDVIPGRSWLLLGDDGPLLAGVVRAAYKPSMVNVLEHYVEPLPFESGSFDVAACAISQAMPAGIMAEMRRVIWPGGTVAAFAPGSAGDLERLFREAGLHAVQMLALPPGAAVKGAR